MAKYLFSGAYIGEGVMGLLHDGGTGRVKAVKEAAKSMGGTVDSFYFAFGKHDFFVVVDLPDNISVAALALAVASSGRVSIDTTVLLTPEEVDAAVKKHPDYRAPGT